MRSLYYGWLIVGVALVMFALIVGTLMNAFSLFVLPVSEEFNLSRADTNTAAILLNFGGALFAPFVGRFLDRVPVRRVVAVGAVLLGGSLVGLGLSHSLWVSAAIIFVPLAIASHSAGMSSASVLVARWFSVHRGRAMAIAIMGMSLGGIVVAPAIGQLIEGAGWRTTLIIVGVALSAIILAMLPVIRERPGPDDHEVAVRDPQPEAQRAAQPTAPATPKKPQEILSNSQFWLVALSTAIVLGVSHAIMITIVPLGRAANLDASQSASLIAVLSVGGIVGKLGVAWMGDRLNKALLLAGLFVLCALVNAALSISSTYEALLVCVVAMGVVVGAATPVFYSLLASIFGAASFGTALGLATPLITIVGAASMRFSGEVFDRTGGYDDMFIAFAGASALAAAVMALTRFAGRAGAAARTA